MSNQAYFDKAHALASSVIGFEFELYSDMVRGRIVDSLSKLLGKKIINFQVVKIYDFKIVGQTNE